MYHRRSRNRATGRLCRRPRRAAPRAGTGCHDSTPPPATDSRSASARSRRNEGPRSELAPNGAEKYFSELRVPEQRQRRRAVPVEVGGPLQERHDAVYPRELHERIDRAIVQARGEGPELQPDTNLGSQARAPSIFVCAKALRTQIVP